MFDKKTYMKEYRKRNKEENRIYQLRYYHNVIKKDNERHHKFKDNHSKRMKKWYKENDERIKEKSRIYRIENKDRLIEYYRRYNQKNKSQLNEYKKLYNRKHPEKIKAYRRERKKKQRSNKCLKCGSEEELEFHHIDYNKDEGITLCKRCHKNLHWRGK